MTQSKRFHPIISKTKGIATVFKIYLHKREFEKNDLSPPAGLLVRGKIFEKNNMVSNDSKLPNSARNAIKKFFFGGGGKRRRTAAAAVPPPFFFKDTKTWGN